MTVYTLWGGGLPAGTTSTNGGTRTDGIQITVSETCQLEGYGYYLPAGGTTTGASYTGNLWTTTTGATGALVAGSTQAGAGTWQTGAWNYFTLAVPATLVPGVIYVPGVSSVDELQFLHNYWVPGGGGAGGMTVGPINVPSAAAAAGGFQQANVSAANSFPNASTGSWYGIDIMIATLPPPAAGLDGAARLILGLP